MRLLQHGSQHLNAADVNGAVGDGDRQPVGNAEPLAEVGGGSTFRKSSSAPLPSRGCGDHRLVRLASSSFADAGRLLVVNACSDSRLDFPHRVADPDHAGLNDSGVDTAQMELLANS